VAGWIGWAHGWDSRLARRRFLLAALAGAFPSVYGTLANGQACLVLMPLLAFGCIAMLEGGTRGRLAGGVGVGLATIVKLTPGAMIVPLLLGRRIGAAGGVVAGALGALAIATLLAPFAGEGSGGLTALIEPDSYFTNQSINGTISRLVLPSERTTPLFNHAFDPRWPVVVVTALFGLATFFVLWRARRSFTERRGLALGLGIALIASLIGAPKGTYWNQVMILVPAGLLIAVEMPRLQLRSLPTVDRCLIATWLVGTWIQTIFWMFPPPKAGGLAAVTMLLTSASLYGLLALWVVFARRLLTRDSTAD
jgi:hypothetical protein